MTVLPFVLSARVIHGNHLGRTLGYPTANLDLLAYDPFPLPAGVYAVYAETDGTTYRGMANAGYRPTVSGNSFTLEVHLIGFSGDLYGKSLTVTFLHRIREERKFESLDALIGQLGKDEQDVLKWLP